ncbi:hypothetical protein [Nonomuraea sp. NPDC050310]|uniref:hypothetical protein n=1 Tax=Nonomuraea sp. NPDC050310 TaxID=3154935 RepID=UPI0033ED657E
MKRRHAAALALIPSLVLPATAAAAEGRTTVCESNVHNPQIDNAIRVCAQLIKGDVGYLSGRGTVRIGRYATRATGCKLTVWFVVSDRKGMSPGWSTQRSTHSCDYALLHRGVVASKSASVRSSAGWGQLNACVDLYYNGSSRSGAQLCARTDAMSLSGPLSKA